MNIHHALENLLSPYKLSVRGIVDDVTLMPNSNCKSIVLIGTIGGEYFDIFKAQAPQSNHPLDDWIKSILNPIAYTLNAQTFYPSDTPYQPFLSWAKSCEPIFTTPLGIMAHPNYGSWHAYRGALGFNEILTKKTIDTDTVGKENVILDKNVLYNACPVGAFSDSGYNVPACINYIKNDPEQKCFNGGCLSRHALNVGADYNYSTEHHQFHMQAFIRNH